MSRLTQSRSSRSDVATASNRPPSSATHFPRYSWPCRRSHSSSRCRSAPRSAIGSATGGFNRACSRRMAGSFATWRGAAASTRRAIAMCSSSISWRATIRYGVASRDDSRGLTHSDPPPVRRCCAPRCEPKFGFRSTAARWARHAEAHAHSFDRASGSIRNPTPALPRGPIGQRSSRRTRWGLRGRPIEGAQRRQVQSGNLRPSRSTT